MAGESIGLVEAKAQLSELAHRAEDSLHLAASASVGARHTTLDKTLAKAAALASKLADMPTGVITRMTGLLVDVQDAGLSRPTSLSRNDTGPGACEILYVESIEVIRPED